MFVVSLAEIDLLKTNSCLNAEDSYYLFLFFTFTFNAINDLHPSVNL